MLYTIIGLLVIILDQGVKMYVDKVINYTNKSIGLIPGVLSLVRVENDGAAFSFLAGGGARIWFIVLTLIFTVIVVLALVTNFISGKFGRWCMVLVTAGGLSNCLDRVLYGFVIDMFKIELFDFAVFNVADIFITVFCIAFIIYILFGGEKEREYDDEEDEFDEDDDDDYRPARSRKAKAAKIADLYDDDEDEDEKLPLRSKKSRFSKAAEEDDYEEKPAKSRRSRGYEDDKIEEMFGANADTTGRWETGRTSGAPERIERNSKRSRNVSLKEASSENVRKHPDREVSARSAVTEDVSAEVSTVDPFAEWERANKAARAAVTKTESVPSAPVAPAKKAPRQAANATVFEDIPAPAASSSDISLDPDEFDLDSILNEFR